MFINRDACRQPFGPTIVQTRGPTEKHVELSGFVTKVRHLLAAFVERLDLVQVVELKTVCHPRVERIERLAEAKRRLVSIAVSRDERLYCVARTAYVSVVKL